MRETSELCRPHRAADAHDEDVYCVGKAAIVLGAWRCREESPPGRGLVALR